MFDAINTKNKDFFFRYLKHEDYNKGLFFVLSQLTKTQTVSKESFQEQLNLMKLSNSNHINIVAEDTKTNQIIAFGSLIICETIYGRVGKIENIVTCESVRGKGLGKTIIELLKDEGWKNECQKITLFCEEKNVKFYEKLNFKQQGIMYAAYQ